jgi:hypothetical protein
MIRYTRIFITFLLTAIAFGVTAQSTQSIATSSSPYSRYGLGDISPGLLPQNVAMGGIATAINRLSGYNNINPANPASYGLINFTTIDAGIYSNISNFSQSGVKGSTNSDFRLSHVAFAIPTSNKSAVSFGLLPYSEMGYNNVQSSILNRSNVSGSVDTVNKTISSGTGTLSKAYLGWGVGIGKHILIGANASYIFGNLQQFYSYETNLYGTLNSRVERGNSVHGFDFDFGAQYSIPFSESKRLILGYSGSSNSKINGAETYIVSQYTYTASGVENIPADSIISNHGDTHKIQLPWINHFGISFQNEGRLLIGADYTMGNWSSLSIAGENQGLKNSQTFNIGGQFTPDINSLHNVFSRTDYRLGFIYDESYLVVNNNNIKTKAITFGMGIPLAPNLSSFYKINFTAEVGQRGSLQPGLVQQNFINLSLSFIVNDRWFQKFKFD